MSSYAALPAQPMYSQPVGLADPVAVVTAAYEYGASDQQIREMSALRVKAAPVLSRVGRQGCMLSFFYLLALVLFVLAVALPWSSITVGISKELGVTLYVSTFYFAVCRPDPHPNDIKNINKYCTFQSIKDLNDELQKDFGVTSVALQRPLIAGCLLLCCCFLCCCAWFMSCRSCARARGSASSSDQLLAGPAASSNWLYKVQDLPRGPGFILILLVLGAAVGAVWEYTTALKSLNDVARLLGGPQNQAGMGSAVAASVLVGVIISLLTIVMRRNLTRVKDMIE